MIWRHIVPLHMIPDSQFAILVASGHLFKTVLQFLTHVPRSGPGLVQVWFSLQLKFNSFELDSEVGRLVIIQSAIFTMMPNYNLFGFGELRIIKVINNINI